MQDFNLHPRCGRAPARRGFTLVELMLSLALVVVAAALIGSIMQLYARNFMTRSDDVRRMQLAQAILHMIADDIRAVVTEQEYDGSVLEQQLGASDSGAAGGGATADTGGSNLASSTVPPDSGLDDPTTTDTANLALDVETIASLPPGLYGDQYSLTLTVSRVPRPDEYLVAPPSLLEGTLVDVPGDIKTVTYYVQAPTMQGVADELNQLSGVASDGISAGLVRRALDRAVIAYAQEVGNVQAMERTGDLIAPEVVSIEFAYYDGTQGQWVYQWDSSQQSLPWLVQIAVAMQSATGEETGKFQPGTPISSLTLEDRQAFGIEVYELVVAIPGANLKAADAAQADAAGGLDSVGL
ncbi:MAG: prepilin-type N-terminal cleavage/methylation domain-containing protein [Planctomycetota bacterium]|nr:MAG: prepilin-type N-terminal cleavage/methylation domain-containing protein [Planctomycetota bacterium]